MQSPGLLLAMLTLSSHQHVAAAASAIQRPVRPFTIIAPRHPDGSDWPWISQIGPMRQHRFTSIYIQNTLEPFPKATRFYVGWQYLRAMRAVQDSEVIFTFGVDINLGMASWPAKLFRRPKRIYVGFTQDGVWPQKKIDRLSHAMRECDAVTVFSHEERELYIRRYGLDPQRVHLIPIHTDETENYRQYPDERPHPEPYVLSMGAPNRRFLSIAKACHALQIPLVIITRPWYKADSLDELARLGAIIITNADKVRSLTYLKHARATAMAFETDALPGALTTIMHASFMRTPCVVSSCLGISDYVVDSETGYVVPHGDEKAMQAAIDRLWNEPGLVERFSEAAYQRAQRLYSLEAAAEAFHALTQRVVAQGS